MFILLNKNKIYSCVIAFFLVGILFGISLYHVPNQEVRLIHTSSNITNSIQENYVNKINNIENTNKWNFCER